MTSWLIAFLIACSIAFTAFGATDTIQSPKVHISENGADYDLFAVLSGTNCAQQLAYGPSDVTQDGQVDGTNSAYLSTGTAGKNTAHTEWLQIVTSDGATELFRIYWTFATARTLADHFVSAVNVGEAVSYRVVRADGTNYFYNGVWHFSDNAGDMTAKFATPTTLPSFSDSNGAWGAGQGDIDGSETLPRTSPVQFWGVGTFQGTDTNSCIHVYQQSDPTYFPYVKTYMYYSSPVAGPVYPTISPTRAPSAPTAIPTAATTVANVPNTYDMFAVLTGTTCTEALVYGPSAVTTGGQVGADNTAYLSTGTAGKNDAHNEWLQVVTSDGVTELFRIYWTFATARTLADHFITAVNVGEAVSYRVVTPDGTTYNYNGVWHFSDEAGDMASKFASTMSIYGFSANGGAWGAGEGNVDGNVPLPRTSPVSFWGVGNFDGTDFNSCIHVYQQSDPTYYPFVRTYMYYSTVPVVDLNPTAKPTSKPKVAPTQKPNLPPTLRPNPLPTAKPVVEPTEAPVSHPTEKPNAVPTAKPNAVPTGKPIAVPTEAPTFHPTGKPVAAPTFKPNAEPTNAPIMETTVSPTAKAKASPTAKPNAEPTGKPIAEPTDAPIMEPTVSPTAKAKASPTAKPNAEPTGKPNAVPTLKPNAEPTGKPVESPTAKPNAEPTEKPIVSPTAKPNAVPTGKPVDSPTAKPNAVPTHAPVAPTEKPTVMTTEKPSCAPTRVPTSKPTLKPTCKPSEAPTRAPTSKPSVKPSNKPSVAPTRVPTGKPILSPTAKPSTRAPTVKATVKPSLKPSLKPTIKPTLKPSLKPTSRPSLRPTRKPTVKPTTKAGATSKPTHKPSMRPSRAPTRAPSTAVKAPSRPPSKPTHKPSMRPSRAPTRAPSTAAKAPSRPPTRVPTRLPTQKNHRQINCKVVQIIIGVTIWWYRHNPHGCNDVLKAAIVAAIHGIAIGDIQEPEVYEALLATDDGNLRVAVREDAPEGISVEYTITVDADSGLTYDDISTQLVDSVESNHFNEMLQQYAVAQNVTEFASASTLSIETTELATTAPDSSSRSSGDALGGDAIIGIAIGLCALLLMAAYLARLYVLRRAASASTLETSVAESPMTTDLSASKHDPHTVDQQEGWTDNPLSAYSSHGTNPSAPQASWEHTPHDVESPKSSARRPVVSVMAVPVSTGMNTLGVTVAEACDKDEA
eukprot:CAMPEP_0185013132 /NCGR_PEP_ID=MMETSP1098-20130426/98647_1 /TAXON_ID=89044 /ORGANISM="Spumella elongata, Strain CCAP 955/1" /LENGTH=1185 /DNA_ID=CAMNT_0027542197 /DNA_START=6 /DNA_END=3563 /DNA_ORIENTATION=+